MGNWRSGANWLELGECDPAAERGDKGAVDESDFLSSVGRPSSQSHWKGPGRSRCLFRTGLTGGLFDAPEQFDEGVGLRRREGGADYPVDDGLEERREFLDDGSTGVGHDQSRGSAIIRIGSPRHEAGRFGSIDRARDVTGTHQELATEVDRAETIVGGLVESDQQVERGWIMARRGDRFGVDQPAQRDLG